MADTPAPNKAPVPLNHKTHAGLRVKPVGSTDHIKGSHFARIYTSEFSMAGLDSPVIFMKGPDDRWMAGAMWGLEPGENLFVEGGRWTGGYFPSFVRAFPFALLPDPEKPDHFYVGLFEDSEYVNKDEGEMILDDEGNDTEWFKQTKEFLTQIYQQDQMTTEFVTRLDEMGLLTTQSLNITPPGQDASEGRQIGGFFIVDKEKLKELSDEDFNELRQNGGLEVIYSHLMSLNALGKLTQRKELRDNNKDAA